ncbi:MAG: topoisomerase C-terminal repeat-containing protein, partial [Candidatus Competibacteraceae bacterium]|nr:topoisomerase C-terminal repeat-containing protein [Candidatus Competibacteraceae bacterium]
GAIQVLRGRYGPYITDGKKNAKVPKDRAPDSLTLEECKALLAEAPEKKSRRKAAAKGAKEAKGSGKAAKETKGSNKTAKEAKPKAAKEAKETKVVKTKTSKASS